MFAKVTVRTGNQCGVRRATRTLGYSRPGLFSRRALTRTGVQIAAMCLLSLGAAGCGPDRGQAVAACEGEADRFYPGIARDVNSPRSQFVIGCMGSKGFAFDFEAAQCDSRHPMSSQAECYRSRGVFDWFTSGVAG